MYLETNQCNQDDINDKLTHKIYLQEHCVAENLLSQNTILSMLSECFLRAMI